MVRSLAPFEAGLIYLAAPWFNQSQMERMQKVLRLLKEWSCLGTDRRIFAPYEVFVCPPDASKMIRRRTYEGNLCAIADCDIVVAITDEKDMGTIFEVGYAAAIRDLHTRQLPIVVGCALDLPEGAKFNLMLAEGFDVICTSIKDLRDYLAHGTIPEHNTLIE